MTTCTMPSANPSRTPWYRQRWPWLLMAGPATVVVAALVTAWVAASGADPLLANDYYKRGLLVNQLLAAQPRAPEPVSGAVLRFASDGGVRVELSVVGDAALPATLRLTLARPADRGENRVTVLVRGGDGSYAGRTGPPSAGRWIVTLEADAWRLPTTVVEGTLSIVRLGVADADR
jgi:uncharacterized protein